MMNLSQTKLVGLTMELDLKAMEYKKLCDKLDELKEKRIDSNDERLLTLKELFKKNHDEIVEINKQIKEIKETEELKEKQKVEQYNPENIFKKKNNTSKTEKEEIAVVQNKQSIFVKFIEKIKKIFRR